MSSRPRPFVPTMNAAEEGTLKGQLIKLGMYTIAASFEVEAERAAQLSPQRQTRQRLT